MKFVEWGYFYLPEIYKNYRPEPKNFFFENIKHFQKLDGFKVLKIIVFNCTYFGFSSILRLENVFLFVIIGTMN
jgi:hypothetical protein